MATARRCRRLPTRHSAARMINATRRCILGLIQCRAASAGAGVRTLGWWRRFTFATGLRRRRWYIVVTAYRLVADYSTSLPAASWRRSFRSPRLRDTSELIVKITGIATRHQAGAAERRSTLVTVLTADGRPPAPVSLPAQPGPADYDDGEDPSTVPMTMPVRRNRQVRDRRRRRSSIERLGSSRSPAAHRSPDQRAG